jgi:hypothetical protein
MSSTHTPVAVTATSNRRIFLRWMASFVGFPLGGLAALLIVGPVEDTTSAVLGGLVAGLVLGAAQAFGLRHHALEALRWAVATAVGLSIGLAVGAGAVDHGTALSDLAIQGLVSGAAVGLTQAVVLGRAGARPAAVWPVYLGAVWALGWTVTTLVGVQVEDQFTVFGASGAITVTALTSVLPLTLARRGR